MKQSNATYKDSSKVFVRACKIAGIAATKRQASKFRNHTGLAHSFKHQALSELGKEARQK